MGDEVYTVYICNLPVSATVDILREKFSEYGDPVDVRIPNGNRRYAFVDYKNEEERKEAVEKGNGKIEIDGSTLTVEESKRKKIEHRSRDRDRDREYSRRDRDYSPRRRDSSPRYRRSRRDRYRDRDRDYSPPPRYRRRSYRDYSPSSPRRRSSRYDSDYD